MKIFCVLYVLLFLTSARTSAEEPIKVGVISSLTGPQASWGNDTRDILLFLNAKYGRGRVEFVIEDDRCDSKEATIAAHKLVEVDRVRYVIGPLCSGASLAAAPILNRAKVLTIATLPGVPSFSNAGDYIFRSRPSDEGAGRLLAEYIGARHRRIGVITEQTDYALGLKEQFMRFAAPYHLAVLEEDQIPGSPDFRPSLLRFRQKSAEAILMLVQNEDPAANIARQRQEIKWRVPLYGSSIPASNTFRKLAGDAVDGIIFAVIPGFEDGDSEARKLQQEYVAAYGPMRSVEYIFECTYDAYMALVQALRSGGDPKEYLYTTTFKGLSGNYYFDKQGDIQGLAFVLKQYRGLSAHRLQLESAN
jgi:branched-chain amino acid transport system substrate-binding protein